LRWQSGIAPSSSNTTFEETQQQQQQQQQQSTNVFLFELHVTVTFGNETLVSRRCLVHFVCEAAGSAKINVWRGPLEKRFFWTSDLVQLLQVLRGGTWHIVGSSFIVVKYV
jgi:hypothetical protein